MKHIDASDVLLLGGLGAILAAVYLIGGFAWLLLAVGLLAVAAGLRAGAAKHGVIPSDVDPERKRKLFPF